MNVHSWAKRGTSLLTRRLQPLTIYIYCSTTNQRSYTRWLYKIIYKTEMKFWAVLGSWGCREKNLPTAISMQLFEVVFSTFLASALKSYIKWLLWLFFFFLKKFEKVEKKTTDWRRGFVPCFFVLGRVLRHLCNVLL